MHVHQSMAREINKRNRSPSPEKMRERLASPLLTMNGGYDEILEFLCHKIKEQRGGMITVTEKLEQMRKWKGHAQPQQQDGPPNLWKLVFAGPTGCGKTECVRWLKYLLGMDKGYEHEGQFIEVERDDDLETLISMFNECLNLYNDDYHRGHGHHHLLQERQYPRFILLTMDNLTPTFLASIKSLLSSGHHASSFRLPTETMLLIVFTCNYGESQIRGMRHRAEHEAIHFIQRDMNQHELSEAQVRLMGRVVPFYPLKAATLREILMERLEHFIRDSEICRQFGEIKYDGDVKNKLIDKVIDLAGPGWGIRCGLGELFDKINGFFEKALRELTRREKEFQQLSRNDVATTDGLVISLREIDTKEMEAKLEKECDQFIRDIIHNLLKDPQSLEMIEYHREKNEHINALSMRFDQHHLATSDLCGSVIYAHQQNTLYNHCQFGVPHRKYERLKEENRGLRRAIEKVGSLIHENKSKRQSSPPLFKEIRHVITESTKYIPFNSDTDDENDDSSNSDIATLNGRVEEVIDNDEKIQRSLSLHHMSTDSSSTSTSSSSEEEVEGKVDRIIRLYGGIDAAQLEEMSLPSEIDESSGEDRARAIKQIKEKKKKLKEKLFNKKKQKVQKSKCKTCGEYKDLECFNPQLKERKKGASYLSFRKECGSCRSTKK